MIGRRRKDRRATANSVLTRRRAIIMKIFQYSAAAVAIALSLATPAPAQAPPDGWVQVQATSAMLGIGGASGEGQLTLPMLGSNCVFPFKASGFGVGIQVGISKISAAGPVRGMTKLEDFPGNYSATHGEATILAGGGGTEMKNNANNVTIALSSQTQGLNIGVAGAGVTVSMPIAPPQAPPVLVL